MLHDIINNKFARKAVKGRRRPDRCGSGCRWPCGHQSPLRWCRKSATGSTARWRCRAPSPPVAVPSWRPRPWGRLCLHRLGLHRHARSPRRRRLQTGHRRGNSDDIIYSTCSPACTATTWRRPSALRAGPEHLPEVRPQQDELWRRAAKGQGLEGHLGLRPGHRCHPRGHQHRRPGGTPAARKFTRWRVRAWDSDETGAIAGAR